MRAQLRADTSQEDSETEGLGDIVVGAAVQSTDGVIIGGGGGQHDHGGRKPGLAHGLAGVSPVAVRQVDVQQHEIRPNPTGGFNARLGAIRLENGEFIAQAKLFGQGAAQLVVVVDHKEGFSLRHRRQDAPVRSDQPSGETS